MNIIGSLTRDAEVRNLPNEKKVVNFSIATNDNYRNKQGEQIEQTTYFECAYWISPKMADFLTKGTFVELTGRAYTNAWLGKDGEPHAGLNSTPHKSRFAAVISELKTSILNRIKKIRRKFLILIPTTAIKMITYHFKIIKQNSLTIKY